MAPRHLVVRAIVLPIQQQRRFNRRILLIKLGRGPVNIVFGREGVELEVVTFNSLITKMPAIKKAKGRAT